MNYVNSLMLGILMSLLFLSEPDLVMADEHFWVSVGGENCLIEGGDAKKSFYVARAVKASNEEDAEEKAIALVKSEIGSKLKNKPEDPPDIYVGKISDSTEEQARQTNQTGYQWFDN